ncbi:hypothetical protein L465_00395 [Enterobacter sp. BIDMC 29]|nr:hypothetical protein L465_00395 [Enterobacter sp. BIDMC 29]
MYIDSFKQYFHEVDDPRQSAKVTYLFFDILFGTLCGRWCTDRVRLKFPLPTEIQTELTCLRTECGRATDSRRFSTATPMATSVC